MALATTRQEIEGQSARERMWNELDYSYGKQIEQSNANYDKAVSESDRALLQRGMQRSSYGRQVHGNLLNQKNIAANDLGKAKIADYGNRLYQIERDEVADAQWEKSYALQQEQLAFQREQAAAQAAWQREQAEIASRQWQAEFDEGVRQYDTTLAAKTAGSGGGGGGGGGNKPGKDKLSWEDWYYGQGGGINDDLSKLDAKKSSPYNKYHVANP